MIDIGTAKKRNAMDLTKIADFPYNSVDIEVKYFTGKQVWINIKNDGVYRISRPSRYAWLNLKVGDIKSIEKRRIKNGNRPDKIEHYYAYLHVVGERNESLPYNTKMSSIK